MEVVFAHCAGLDVHKKTVVACVFVSDPQGKIQRLIETFLTTLAGLEALAAWLSGFGVTYVAMESTGVYWKPVFNVLAPLCMPRLQSMAWGCEFKADQPAAA